MSKFSDNIQNRQECKQDRKSCKRELGKFCYDMAKITYTAMIAGPLFSMATDMDFKISASIFGVCTWVAITFAYFGYKFNSFK